MERQRVDSGSLLRLRHRLIRQDAAQPAGEILRMVRALTSSHRCTRRGLPQPGGKCQDSVMHMWLSKQMEGVCCYVSLMKASFSSSHIL